MTSLEDREEARPPFFSSWTPIYLIVVGSLAAMITLFYLFSQIYR